MDMKTYKSCLLITLLMIARMPILVTPTGLAMDQSQKYVSKHRSLQV